jgi:hypothetical protein
MDDRERSNRCRDIARSLGRAPILKAQAGGSVPRALAR